MNKKLQRVVFFSATIVTLFIGIMVITGWVTHNNFMRDIFPGHIRMKFNCALGLILSSVVLLLHQSAEKNKSMKLLSIILSATVAFTGLVTLTEYIFDFYPGIDELFFKEEYIPGAAYNAGRMSPLAAFNFILIGIGLLMLDKSKTASFQFYYLFGIGFTSLLLLVGFNFISDIPAFIGFDVQAAVAFIMLPVAVWSSQPMLQKQISFERKLFTGFGAIIILMLFIGLFYTYYNNKNVYTDRMVWHSNKILNESEITLSLLKDIESGGRGYIISHDSSYLSHFIVARNTIFDHVKNMKELTKDNPSQQLKIDSLSSLIARRIDYSHDVISVRNEKGFEGIISIMGSRIGKHYTDEIRKITRSIQDEENKLLLQRETANERSMVSFNRATLVFLAGVLILVIIILFSIRNNIVVRRRAEEKIIESEQMFSTLFNKSPIMKAIAETSSGRYNKVNEAFADFFELPVEEITGKTSVELNMVVHPDERDEILKKLQDNGSARDIEMEVANKKGEVRWVSTNIDRINLNGKDSFLTAAIDITERKLAEDALLKLSQELEQKVIERTEEIKRSEKKYRYLFQNNPMPMWVFDLKTFKFLDVNEMAIQKYGYSRDEFLSMTAIDIRPEEDKNTFKSADHSFESNPSNYNRGIWNHRKKDGTIIQVEIIAHSIIFEGKPARLILSNDVTEKKKYEDKLHASETRFRSIIEQFPYPVITYAPDGNYITANEAWEIMWQAKREDVKSYNIRSDEQLIKSGLSQDVEKAFAGEVAISEPYLYDPALIGQTGRKRWIQMTLYPLKNPQDEILEVILVLQDVTDNKEAEGKIIASERQLRETLDNMLEGAQIVGFDWRYKYVNDSLTRHGKYSREELIGYTVMEKYPGIEHTEIFKVYEQCFNERVAIHLENEFTFPDKTTGWFELSFQPVPEGIFILSIDITERKKAEQAIKLAEANYREIFDKASDAIYVHEIDTGKIVEVNQRACELTGYTKQELISTHPQEFITDNPHYTLQHAMNYLQKAAAGEQQIFEWLGKNKDGSYNWFEVNLKKASIAGKERILAFFREINDRKKAQEEIQKLNEGLELKVKMRTEQLEEVNNELEAFSYSVSHDLRAPLRAINGFSKMIEDDYNSVFNEKGKRQFSRIKENTKKMGLLIDDLLEFSRLGRKEISRSLINMNELVETVFTEINTSVEHNAEVKIYPLHEASADSTMIKQVMINLISNAIKYSAKTENPFIEIKSQLSNNEIIYSVTDNGVGFNNEYAHKLFGVFQRLHSPEDFEGTGVGLALVKRIINKHGGGVWASGEINKGATFCFTLPVSNYN